MTKFLLLLICSTLLVGSMAAAQEGDSTDTEATAPADRPRVAFETTLGTFVVELHPDRTPITVSNVLEYVDEGFYEGTAFHRVIDGFMIQGGGFTQEDNRLQKKETKAGIANEARKAESNLRGTVAMARTNNPHSATAQFFVNLVDNTRLDHPSFDGWGYTVFGDVVSGMEVVDAIAKVATGRIGPHGNVPTEPVVILSAKRAEAGAPAEAEAEAAPATDEG